MDENMAIENLDKDSLNDYYIYKDIINTFKNQNLLTFNYKDGKIVNLCRVFRYTLNNGETKYFYNGSKIIYFTNKNENIILKPFFIHDQTSLDEALKKTKIQNGIIKNIKNNNSKKPEKNESNKPSDSPDSTFSKSSIYSINSWKFEDILNTNFNLIKEANAIGVKLILNEKRFNDRFVMELVSDLDFNFKYITDNYIKNEIEISKELNDCVVKLKHLVKQNNTKSYCFIFGPKGTGKTTMLLTYLKFFNIPRLYFSLKIMSKLDFKKRRIKKYALMETIYTFDDLKQMKKFSDIKIDEISDSSNLLEFILSYIQTIVNFYSKEKKKINKIWIVIDDYNQDLYDNNNIIEKIIDYINQNKTKLFLCILGDGRYINEKFYQYYSNQITNYFAIYWNISKIDEISQKNKILTLPKYYYKYKDSIDRDIEEKIKENLSEKFKKMNLNSLLFLNKIINSTINIKNFKDELINLPLEYLTIDKYIDKNNNILLNLSFNSEIYKTVFDSTIHGLLKIECLKAKTIIFKEENKENNGIDFEDLIIEQFWNNTFEFINFPDNNKLIVEQIFNLKNNKSDIRNDLNFKKPIIIRQKNFNGKYYDLLFILSINDKIYAIFIQIGLSKKGKDINIYLKNLTDNEEKYKEGIKTLINHNIDEIGFLLIFNYKHQKDLLDKNIKSEGVGFCDNNKIDFLIYKDFNLFKNVDDKEPIKYFEVTKKTLIYNEINNEISDISKYNNLKPLYPLNEKEKSLIFNYINNYDELNFFGSIKNFNEIESIILNNLEQINVFIDNKDKYFYYNNQIFKIKNNQLEIIKNRKEKNNTMDIYFLNKKTKRKPEFDN
jgi:hypothetical protein